MCIRDRIKSAPLMLPARHLLNLGVIVGFVVMTVLYAAIPHDNLFARQSLLGLMTLLALCSWHIETVRDDNTVSLSLIHI